ncbi:hypothetical protein [Rhizobium herbae]
MVYICAPVSESVNIISGDGTIFLKVPFKDRREAFSAAKKHTVKKLDKAMNIDEKQNKLIEMSNTQAIFGRLSIVHWLPFRSRNNDVFADTWMISLKGLCDGSPKLDLPGNIAGDPTRKNWLATATNCLCLRSGDDTNRKSVVDIIIFAIFRN